MGKYQDLSGKRFGKLTVIKRVDNVGKYAAFLCRCDCGSDTIATAHNLNQGCVKSCGCLRATKNKTHGMSKSRLYNVWINIKQRCYNTNDHNFKSYGGRGITMCDEWRDSFQAFYEWAMANGYDENAPFGECTLDRIDVDKGYYPDNCRWADDKIQANNKRLDKKYTYNGKTLSIKEWCKEIGFYWVLFDK